MSHCSQCSLFYDEPSVISLLIGCPSQTVPCSIIIEQMIQPDVMHIRGVDRRELRGTPLMFPVFAHRAVTPPTQLNIIRELNMEPHVDLFQQRVDAPRSD